MHPFCGIKILATSSVFCIHQFGTIATDNCLLSNSTLAYLTIGPLWIGVKTFLHQLNHLIHHRLYLLGHGCVIDVHGQANGFH